MVPRRYRRGRGVVSPGASGGAPGPDEGVPARGVGMFLGEFQHSLDAKGRVILPAKFRDQLGSRGDHHQRQGPMPRGVHRGGVRGRGRPGVESCRSGGRGSSTPPGSSSPAPATSRPTSRAGSPSRRRCGPTPASNATSWSSACTPGSRSGTRRRWRELDQVRRRPPWPSPTIWPTSGSDATEPGIRRGTRGEQPDRANTRTRSRRA